ncbi:MAG: hypothetical protein ACE5H4_12370 [Candidatus Thorarchaeota archaeon]
MKHVYKHAFMLTLMAFLLVSPAVAATVYSGNYSPAQTIDDPMAFFQSLIEDGAELVFANIDDEGAPQVVYGQLGIPSASLALDQPMYDGCIAMVLVATYGEMLEYLFQLIGVDFFGGGGGGGISALQIPTTPQDLFGLLGTEFNLLVTAFLDLSETQARSQMGQIVTHLGTGSFGFTFQEIFSIRIDQSLFPPEAGITLPFQAIDLFIHKLTNIDVVDTVFDAMIQDGFAAAIDSSLFASADAGAAGLLAIPDMQALIDMIEGFTGTPPPLASADFVVSQFENFTLAGPVALAGVGYFGDQLLSSSDTQLDVFSDLLGSIGTVNPLTDGLSVVVVNMPYNVNVTSYTPENEALNQTYYDNASNIVFWNATALGPQTDYTLYFNASLLPPMITLERTFLPTSATVGDSVDVTVTVTNGGTEPITGLNLTDDDFMAVYPDVMATGYSPGSWSTLAPSASQSITYTVTFVNEGRYTFPSADLTYVFNGNVFSKSTRSDGFDVEADVVGLLSQMIADGWPYTGAVLGIVGLVGIYSIAGLVRGRGGSEFYQM